MSVICSRDKVRVWCDCSYGIWGWWDHTCVWQYYST